MHQEESNFEKEMLIILLDCEEEKDHQIPVWRPDLVLIRKKNLSTLDFAEYIKTKIDKTQV